MAYPGVLPAGLTYDKPVESFDMLPTCAALADVKPPEGLDGVNLVPYLEGKDSGTPHQTLYWQIDARRAIRQGDWKLIINGKAGEDHKFVWAKATIEGDHVVVSSDLVPHPVAVRYAWANNPEANLYNREHLPASPFRTDDFANPGAAGR